MATKYTGQNALNKLMQLIKTALNGKLDKTGGTMTGKLIVSGADISVKSSGASGGNVSADGNISAANGSLTAGVAVSVLNGNNFVNLMCIGPNAIKIAGAGGGYARVAVGTPTGDNDATPKKYVDDKITSGGVTVDAEMSSTSTNPVQNKIVKNYVDTKVSGLQTASQVQDAIKSAITGVYTPKGSIAFESLPVPVAGKVGWVYNITDAFTTDSNFVEGEGFEYPAGTNVVCAEISAGDYGWDVLAGMIDLTELTATEVQTLWDSV